MACREYKLRGHSHYRCGILSHCACRPLPVLFYSVLCSVYSYCRATGCVIVQHSPSTDCYAQSYLLYPWVHQLDERDREHKILQNFTGTNTDVCGLHRSQESIHLLSLPTHIVSAVSILKEVSKIKIILYPLFFHGKSHQPRRNVVGIFWRGQLLYSHHYSRVSQ